MAVADEGTDAFRKRCGACHSLDTAQNWAGPHLMELQGRAAGSVEGARYSRALKDSKIVWDETTLDQYLAAPRTAVPGTTMTVGVRDEKERRAIIEFLLKR